MMGTWTIDRFRGSAGLLCATMVAGTLYCASPAFAVVKIFDGFGDADRNNDGAVTFYDTDINVNGTWNDATADAALISRGITEVTAAQDPNDKGIVWLGTRSFDTAANLVKSNVKIIDDSVATGGETAAEIHNHGLALGVESRGNGSSFIGSFGQSIAIGPVAGDKLVVSVDFRIWREAANAFTPDAFNELRWGLWQDTDDELGTTGSFGNGGATITWGEEDGNWFASQPGAEGDKGIYSRLSFGGVAAAVDARINWEYNLANINGTTNNGRIFEGTGVSDTPGSGGDTGTIASPPGNGPGGIISDLATYAPHKLSMEIVRLANGLIEVASFVDNVEILRDAIKDTDTGFNVLGPPAFSYDYVGFRNATGDFDYVLDNFMVEIFGSNAGLTGDFNGDSRVDAADYVVWRKGLGTTYQQSDYDDWRANFGAGTGQGGGAVASGVPEPSSVALAAALSGLWLLGGGARRRSY